MARKTTNEFDPTGKSIEDLLDMDVSHISETDLRKYASRIVSAANKRLKRFAASKFKDIAPNKYVRDYIEKGKKFTIKGLSPKEVSAVVKKTRTFLQDRTGNVTEYKKIRKEVQERIGTFRNAEEERAYWKAFRKVQERGIGKKSKGKFKSSTVQRHLYKQMIIKNKSSEEAIEKITQEHQKIYESQEQERLEADQGEGVTVDNVEGKPLF